MKDTNRARVMSSFTFMKKTGAIQLGPEHQVTVELESLTGSGAIILIDAPFSLPETFDMTIRHQRKACRVMWRMPNQVGVRFDEA
ncbi:hypothetical protein [Methylobacterium sp. ID0610]|uniref:hypothetical protein n=1 Tax=Methylobacterium carpenticola TaxID=3344827 RepID=UPI00368B86A7